MLYRELSTRWVRGNIHLDNNSDFFSNLGLGVEHTGLSGLTWLFRYERPEGIVLRIPIFVSSFLSPMYWNRVLWVSTLALLMDETLGELMGHTSPDLKSGNDDAPNIHKTIANKIYINRREQNWLSSSYAKQDAKRQLCLMEPVASVKRQREESIDGLVILKATHASVSASSTHNISVDVTRQLQFWTENSRLRLPASSKSLLLGFYDLAERDHCQYYSYLTKSKKSENCNECDSSRSSFIHQWIDSMIIWLSRLRIGEEDIPSRGYLDDGGDWHEHDEVHDNEDNHVTVMLTVRYKYRGQVFELTVGDEDALDLPSEDALRLGSSDFVS